MQNMSASIINIVPAIIAVMQSVKGIEKSMTVGNGASSYKGVPDQEVKKIIGDAMAENGLCIIPSKIETNVKIERWDETYNGQSKSKQSVFTEANTKYILAHTSGEWLEVSGYGHGVDSQDKGAGKATTYALKYTLLYIFLVPTGKIDDADNSHSDTYEAPKAKQQIPAQTKLIEKKVLEKDTIEWHTVTKALTDKKVTLEYVKSKFVLSAEIEGALKLIAQ